MEVYEGRPSPGGGNGVFAKKDIKPGTTIMKDQMVMQITKSGPQHTDDEVRHAFNQLRPDQQAQFLALHEGSRTFKTRLLRIYKANAFGHGNVSHIYLDISRINHACVPNAELDLGPDDTSASVTVVAIRPILRDEEVLICYNPMFSSMTAQQRGNLLRAYYGFACSCTSCLLQGHRRMLSDARRRLIKAVMFPLHGNIPPDFDQFNTLTVANAETTPGVASRDLAVPLSHSTHCGYSLLLTQLLEAENMEGVDLASAYFGAASSLMSQMVAMDDIIVLQSAKNVKCWSEKSIEIMTKVRGRNGHATVLLREQWENMQSQPQLYAALEFLGSENCSRFRVQQRDGTMHEAFALWHRSDANQLCALTESTCIAVLSGTVSRSLLNQRKVKLAP
ncbi:hypothetical protein LTR08_006808 [Meristemomyces frigidus]|nr:hypothetical protein LTR08_006808 [Meristemomyces frigidus]